jgi:hypothetical protein
MSDHYVCPCPDGCNGCEVPDFALKEIERLQARVDALETWVSVKDRMPEPGQRVIIFGKRSYQPKGFMRVTLIDGYGAWSGERYPEGHNEVTHWMDVPEPPK